MKFIPEDEFTEPVKLTKPNEFKILDLRKKCFERKMKIYQLNFLHPLSFLLDRNSSFVIIFICF